MEYVETIHTDIDYNLAFAEIEKIIVDHNLVNQNQFSLTSATGEDDWFCSTGRMSKHKHPERFYNTVNNSLQNTYVASLINRYSDYYRWRLLKISAGGCYTIHSDGVADKLNMRLHIPIKTNNDAFLCFYNQMPISGKNMSVRYEHLPAGNSYKVNTTGLHTAINHGTEDRYHLVGVKYENSNNR